VNAQVKEYRVYVLGDGDHITGSIEFTAPDDEAALEQARQMRDGRDIEVWQLDRFLARYVGCGRRSASETNPGPSHRPGQQSG
jgi:hypothetical protein